MIDIHALRHTCASRLAQAGVPNAFTQKLLGHSDLYLTARYYTHTGVKEMRKALGMLEGQGESGERYGLRVV